VAAAGAAAAPASSLQRLAGTAANSAARIRP